MFQSSSFRFTTIHSVVVHSAGLERQGAVKRLPLRRLIGFVIRLRTPESLPSYRPPS